MFSKLFISIISFWCHSWRHRDYWLSKGECVKKLNNLLVLLMRSMNLCYHIPSFLVIPKVFAVKKIFCSTVFKWQRTLTYRLPIHKEDAFWKLKSMNMRAGQAQDWVQFPVPLMPPRQKYTCGQVQGGKKWKVGMISLGWWLCFSLRMHLLMSLMYSKTKH